MDHVDHRDLMSPAERVWIEGFCEKLILKLTILQNKIMDVVGMFAAYNNCEKSFGSEEFMNIVRQAQGIILPHLKS